MENCSEIDEEGSTDYLSGQWLYDAQSCKNSPFILNFTCQRSVSKNSIRSAHRALFHASTNLGLQCELLHVKEVIHILVDGLSDDFGRFCTILIFPLSIPLGLRLDLSLLSSSVYELRRSAASSYFRRFDEDRRYLLRYEASAPGSLSRLHESPSTFRMPSLHRLDAPHYPTKAFLAHTEHQHSCNTLG